MKHHSANVDPESITPNPTAAAFGPKGRPMKFLVAIVVLLMVALGVAGIVYGEADDSPGGQLIGVLLVVGAVVLGVRMIRRSR
jgi:multisubunit Na+/H+ antiporter MnhB subunit